MTDFYCEKVLTGHTRVEVVLETEHVLAFHHTRPYYETHIVIIPKIHIDSLASIHNVDPQLAVDFVNAIAEVSRLLYAKYGGCKVSSNVGSYQSTNHLHWYVHAGNQLRDQDGNSIK